MIKGIGFCAIVFGVFSASCEKTISFAPNNATPELVVEASIENNRAPMVILSSSMNYFSKLTPEILEGSFVHGAEVTISNGTRTHRLKEYSSRIAGGYVLYYYTNDTTNTASLATTFKGEFGKSYSLSIKVNETEYTATTTIPQLAKRIDSLWWLPAPNHPDTTKVVLMGRFVDPPGLGNYTRYYTQIDGYLFFPGLNSVFDDQLVDGKTYNMQIERGVDRNQGINLEEYPFFMRGDSITVKYCNIDKTTYDFWRTIEYSYSNIGNPFAAPNKVLSNIKGGGLGYFGGYAAQYISIVIPY